MKLINGNNKKPNNYIRRKINFSWNFYKIKKIKNKYKF